MNKAAREAAKALRRQKKAARRGMRFGAAAAPSVDTRALRERVLIVCEGARTEPDYFTQFHVNADVVVEGTGANTVSVVEESIRLRDEAARVGTPFTEVWAVFDRDSFPAARFNRALELARAEDIQVAWTNEAFELWYLLHFEYCESALDRSTYAKRLSKYLGTDYKKNDASMYTRLQPLQPAALRNAAKLLKSQRDGERFHPEGANPSTTVHQLVERLNSLRP